MPAADRIQKKLFLVCNAHLDPVWLWEWEEGAAQALATFRIAADLAEAYPEFIFCHNEALLYQWVETYDSELFKRIQKLVKQGRWHIMGGWFLQPDCNMPCGESFVRQIETGKTYFMDKFGVEPRTAVNFDPFGHSRGLVQILKKSGYHSYLFCRPDPADFHLPDNDFTWVGYDGSKIAAHRAPGHYNTGMGKAAEKISAWIQENPGREAGLVLWGVGNHGGGPSRQDLNDIRRLAAESTGWTIRHAVPEDYFDVLHNESSKYPEYRRDLNPWAVGCYTTMSLVKRGHRSLENDYFITEKMAAQAAAVGLMDYPERDLHEALSDLLFCQFHDILPGSSTAEVEASVLRKIGHSRDILNRVRLQAFFSLLAGQKRAQPGEFPLLIYNPHPFAFTSVITAEFQPDEPNMDLSHYRSPRVRDEDGGAVKYQQEKESSNIRVDQRKRVVFSAQLKPGMNRFQADLMDQPETGRHRNRPHIDENENRIVLKSGQAEWQISKASGWVQSYKADGKPVLQSGACQIEILRDYPDPWGMKVKSFHDLRGRFSLMDAEEAARFAGVDLNELAPVRIIETGPVRTVIEALFFYGCSRLCLRYKIPAQGSEFEVEARVIWNEKDLMVKLALPLAFSGETCIGQTAYGRHVYDREDEEWTAQKWVGVYSRRDDVMLTVINDGVYGFDFHQNRLRPSLLRSAAYAAHPVEEGRALLPQDRFEPRIDQGERIFRFWINAGPVSKRSVLVEREAQVKNEVPMVLCCYPEGETEKIPAIVELEGEGVVMTALKFAPEKSQLLIRLFEAEGLERTVKLLFPFLGKKTNFTLSAFEIKSLVLDLRKKHIFAADLLARRLSGADLTLSDI
jgi:alpha-mannosidase